MANTLLVGHKTHQTKSLKKKCLPPQIKYWPLSVLTYSQELCSMIFYFYFLVTNDIFFILFQRQVPTSLLLLTRVMYLDENLSPAEQLKQTISALPETTVSALV